MPTTFEPARKAVDGLKAWLTDEGKPPEDITQQWLEYDEWRIRYSRWEYPTANVLCNLFKHEREGMLKGWERAMILADDALWCNLCANCEGRAPDGDYLCPTCRTM